MQTLDTIDIPEPSPFSLVDYIQAAQMGRRSAVLRLEQGNLHGELVIRDGEAWSSHDDLGDGEPALRRLLLAGAIEGTARVSVEPIPAHPPARNVEASLQGVLLDVARERDEAEAHGCRRETEHEPPEGFDALCELGIKSHACCQQTEQERTETHFDAFYELGVEALLRRDYSEAFEALSAARELRPDHRLVSLNLERLAELGFS